MLPVLFASPHKELHVERIVAALCARIASSNWEKLGMSGKPQRVLSVDALIGAIPMWCGARHFDVTEKPTFWHFPAPAHQCPQHCDAHSLPWPAEPENKLQTNGRLRVAPFCPGGLGCFSRFCIWFPCEFSLTSLKPRLENVVQCSVSSCKVGPH